MVPLRILVSEDEAIIALDIATEIEERGHVLAALGNTVRETLDLIDTVALDIAIIDITLHGEEAYSVLDKLEERGIPVALITARSMDEIPPRYRTYPRLRKPATAADIVTFALGQSASLEARPAIRSVPDV